MFYVSSIYDIEEETSKIEEKLMQHPSENNI